jgi:hypothetical protein
MYKKGVMGLVQGTIPEFAGGGGAEENDEKALTIVNFQSRNQTRDLKEKVLTTQGYSSVGF